MAPSSLFKADPVRAKTPAAGEPAFAVESMADWIRYQHGRYRTRLAQAAQNRGVTPEQQAMLNELVLDFGSTAQCAADSILPIYRGLTGQVGPAMDLAVACGLGWAGAHCLDDVQDGDLSGVWAERSVHAVTFAALAVGWVLPPDILAHMPVAVETRERLQASWRSCSLHLFAGQTEDLDRAAGRTEPQQLAEVVASVSRREPFGWWMRMAAELAGTSDDTAEAYRHFGNHFGVVASVRKDMDELLLQRDYRDLKNGTRTLHMEICRAAMSDTDRAEFDELLHAARDDGWANLDACNAVNLLLRRDRYVAPVRTFLDHQMSAAGAALDNAAPPEPLATMLRQICQM